MKGNDRANRMAGKSNHHKWLDSRNDFLLFFFFVVVVLVIS